MGKKYFISFQWRQKPCGVCGGSFDDGWKPSHEITSVHPLTWLYSTNGNEEQYHILWWTELTPQDQEFIDESQDLPMT